MPLQECAWARKRKRGGVGGAIKVLHIQETNEQKQSKKKKKKDHDCLVYRQESMKSLHSLETKQALHPLLSVNWAGQDSAGISLVAAATSNIFVVTNFCWCDKHMFVATKRTFCHDKSVLVGTKNVLL